jgi:hypothetical protein
LEVSFLFSVKKRRQVVNNSQPQVCKRWLRGLHGAASTKEGSKTEMLV